MVRQEDWARNKGIDKQVRNIQATLEKDVQKRAWVPASNLRPCPGCGVVGDKRKPCNQCQLQGLMRKKLETYAKATKKWNKMLLNTPKQKAKKDELDRRDQDYTTKFGLLKKAAVLVNSERWGDAHKNILQAVKMVKKERLEEKQNRERKERRLKQELMIPMDLELNYEELTSEPITKGRLEKLGIDVPIQKVQIIVEKMCGKDASAYSKNQFLNAQIVELYDAVDAAIKDRRKTLVTMKQKIESLESEPEDKGRRLKGKRLASATQMCEKIKHGEKCTNKSCEYAHSAIELDFVGTENKIHNLQNTIKMSTEKLVKSRAREPWRPAKSGSIELSMDKLVTTRGVVHGQTTTVKTARSRSRKRAKSLKLDIMDRDLDREDFASSFEGI
ncbi:MAG: hypothetical protein P4L67_04175 [Candidatus Pacebacteria bacterium]|nr:hypothetical protein [Candidatus Paceibacterota bacterium]